MPYTQKRHSQATGATIMRANATAYRYERFPTNVPALQQHKNVLIQPIFEDQYPLPDPEEREQIELSAGKFHRAIRFVNSTQHWLHDNTALAWDLNELALEQIDFNPLQAFRTLRAALHQDDKVPEIWNNLGITYLEAGDLDRAKDHFLKALDLNPCLAIAWGNLALANIEEGRYPEACDHFKRALELEPGDPLHLNNLGVLQLELERPAPAKQLFETAIAADPDFHLAYYNLGAADAMLGFYDQSQEHYNQGRQASRRRSCAKQGGD